MIERFNFYDLYGNLIPGIVLLSLGVLPYGLVTAHWLDPNLGSAAIVVLGAYLTGHFLQSIATKAIPSTVARDAQNRPGYPSVLMLNASDKNLSSELKALVKKLVLRRFEITLDVAADVESTKPTDAAEIGRRNSAFFLCRPIANKLTSYSEQFQGLYAMMRGLAVAFTLGAVYDAGWLLSFGSRVSLAQASILLGLALGSILLFAVVRCFGRSVRFSSNTAL